MNSMSNYKTKYDRWGNGGTYDGSTKKDHDFGGPPDGFGGGGMGGGGIC
jgi:hypothetical protein